MKAAGSFDVTLKFETYDDAPGATLARAGGDKAFAGDLVATSHVEMVSARGPGGGAYVAIERVKGTLHGKKGTFVLHHLGLADASGQTLDIRVVPGSATDDLAGLRGRMTIDIRDGKHFYGFDYEVG